MQTIPRLTANSERNKPKSKRKDKTPGVNNLNGLRKGKCRNEGQSVDRRDVLSRASASHSQINENRNENRSSDNTETHINLLDTIVHGVPKPGNLFVIYDACTEKGPPGLMDKPVVITLKKLSPTVCRHKVGTFKTPGNCFD